MTITLWQGNTSPSVEDTIKVNGQPFNLTGATVKFRMRALGSATLKVDGVAAIVPPATDGTVRYDWQAADVDTAGDYLGWWHVTLPSGATQDTDEFAVAIRAHTPTGGAFASSDDLATRLGLDFADEEHDRASQLLDLASGVIRDETGQHISLVDADVLTIPGTTDDRILLPQRPVVSIASVAIDGAPITDWYQVGDALVRRGLTIVDRIIDDADCYGRGRGFGSETRTLTIVYTHGFETIPGRIKAITLNMVVRAWVNPGAVILEAIGDERVEYAPRTEQPRGLELLDAEKRALRNLLGSSGGSVWVGG